MKQFALSSGPSIKDLVFFSLRGGNFPIILWMGEYPLRTFS